MIYDFKEILTDATKKYIEYYIPNPKLYTLNSSTLKDLNVTTNARLKNKEEGAPEVIFVGKSVLSNNTDNPQNLTTNSFSIETTNTVTNSTTNGFNFGVSVGAKFDVGVVEAQTSISTNYNFSSTNSNTESTKIEYNANPQVINVPPHTDVEVSVVLNKIKVKGTVELLANIEGTNVVDYEYEIGPNTNKAHDSLSMPTIFKHYNDPKIKVFDNDNVSFIGEGDFEVSQATTFSVIVKKVGSNETLKQFHITL